MPEPLPIIPLKTYAEVDLRVLAANLRAIRSLAAKQHFYLPTRPQKKPLSVDILPVIKADAYGHGMLETARVLDKGGVSFFGVSDIHEGIALRRAGFKQKILLFESTLSTDAPFIGDYDLVPTVCTLELARALNQYARKIGRRIALHIKVDTGMGRLGVAYDEAFDFVRQIIGLRHLTVHGLYTHFPVADSDKAFTRRQIDKLYQLVTRLDKQGWVIPYIHGANSMGLAGYNTHVLNLARPGLMLYGLYPHPSLKTKIRLQPALSVRSRIIFLKTLEKGQSISYGRTFVAPRRMRVATVPVGYSNGYARGLSHHADVLIDGKRCRVLGKVTMDQIIVDVSSVRRPKLNQAVTILGGQKKSCISADELAAHLKTISYEIVCQLGNRLPRIFKHPHKK